MLGQFVNVDAPISENTAVTVDIANAGSRGYHAFESFNVGIAAYDGHNVWLIQNDYRCGHSSREGFASLFYTPKAVGLPSWPFRQIYGATRFSDSLGIDSTTKNSSELTDFTPARWSGQFYSEFASAYLGPAAALETPRDSS